MLFLPLEKVPQGCGVFSSVRLDEKVHFLPAGLTLKAGLIMWPSNVPLMEM